MTEGLAVRPRQSATHLCRVRPGLRHPRLAAGVAGVGAAAHFFMFAQHGSVLTGVLALIMAVACAPCAISLWRNGTAASARMLMVMSLAMVAIHGAMLLGGTVDAGGMASGHAAHAAVQLAAAPAGAASSADHETLGTLAVMVCDDVAAMLAAVWLFRLRAYAQRRGMAIRSSQPQVSLR